MDILGGSFEKQHSGALMPKRPQKRCHFLHKDAFLGFPRSVLADPKTVPARDTFSEHILSISWCGSDMWVYFGPCRKGAARVRLHPPCGVGRSGSACQTQTMKFSECVQRTCLWVVQFLDRPKRTSGSRETRLLVKSAPKAPQVRKGFVHIQPTGVRITVRAALITRCAVNN